MNSTGLKAEHRLKVLAGSLWMAFILIGVLFPVYWTVLASVKDPKVLANRVPVFWIATPTFEHYISLWTESFIYFDKLTVNSLIIALASTSGAVLMAVFAGLALARLRFPGRERLGMAVFLAYLVPPTLLFIPLYVMMANFKLHDTRVGLVLVNMSSSLPFSIWMLRSYFQTIPRELEEAAWVFGCTRWQAFVKVVLPLALPGMAAAAIFAFVISWNEVFAASVLTVQQRTLTAYLLTVLSESPLHYRFAGGFILIVPSVVFIFAVRRYLFALWGVTSR